MKEFILCVLAIAIVVAAGLLFLGGFIYGIGLEK